MTTQVAPNMIANGPAFSAYQSTLQSVPNSTSTKIRFQTTEFDTTTAYDNTTNYRFQPTVAGYYQVNGAVFFASAAASVVVSVYKNGANWKSGPQTPSTVNSAAVGALVYLNGTTDYIELYAYHVFGSALNTGASAGATYFQASLVGLA